MKRGWGLRALLAVAVVAACVMNEARAQDTNCGLRCRPVTNVPPPVVAPPSSNNNTAWYVLGGVVAPIIGVGIAIHFLPDCWGNLFYKHLGLQPAAEGPIE